MELNNENLYKIILVGKRYFTLNIDEIKKLNSREKDIMELRFGFKTGNEKTIMFVFKDDEIVYVPKYVNSQFKMKQACDDFIEKELENVR